MPLYICKKKAVVRDRGNRNFELDQTSRGKKYSSNRREPSGFGGRSPNSEFSPHAPIRNPRKRARIRTMDRPRKMSANRPVKKSSIDHNNEETVKESFSFDRGYWSQPGGFFFFHHLSPQPSSQRAHVELHCSKYGAEQIVVVAGLPTGASRILSAVPEKTAAAYERPRISLEKNRASPT